jgi:hypothetical protein
MKYLPHFKAKLVLVPATRSRTATLLRLHPNHQSLNRGIPSSETDSLQVTGGVCKANIRIHRNVLICDY